MDFLLRGTKNPAGSPDRTETGFTFSREVMGPRGGRSSGGRQEGARRQGTHGDRTSSVGDGARGSGQSEIRCVPPMPYSKVSFSYYCN